jgi:tyrosinase
MGQSNFYEDFVAIHGGYQFQIHNNSRFLPWHRHFVYEFENALRRIDNSITVPYWDWALDAQAPASSPILQASGFGGDGDPQTLCVTNGYFANWQTNYRTPHCLQRQFINGTGYIDRFWPSSSMASLIVGTPDCK